MSPRKLACPICGSDNIQSVPHAYESGILDTQGRAVGFDSGGDVVVSGSTHTTISRLAQKLAPPKQPDNPGSQRGCGWTILVMIVPALAVFGQYGVCFVCSILIVGLIGTWAMFSGAKDSERQWPAYRKQLDEWQNSWICHKCGNVSVIREQGA